MHLMADRRQPEEALANEGGRVFAAVIKAQEDEETTHLSSGGHAGSADDGAKRGPQF